MRTKASQRSCISLSPFLLLTFRSKQVTLPFVLDSTNDLTGEGTNHERRGKERNAEEETILHVAADRHRRLPDRRFDAGTLPWWLVFCSSRFSGHDAGDPRGTERSEGRRPPPGLLDQLCGPVSGRPCDEVLFFAGHYPNSDRAGLFCGAAGHAPGGP